MEKYYCLDDAISGSIIEKKVHKVAVVVHLHYIDSVDIYAKYIEDIPDFIDVYIFTSNINIEKKVKIEIKRELYTEIKNNRGRDISSLLVAFSKYREQYEYFCFLHDKKETYDFKKGDTDRWIYSIWNNLVCNRFYINRILDVFEQDKSLGILFPPDPMGEYITYWYENMWTTNYDITVELANNLGLKKTISKDDDICSVGTTFWVRRKALCQLFEKDWKYEDFPEEPLAKDGTISHAIERILPYVARENNMNIGVCMTYSYVQDYIKDSRQIMRKMFKFLNREKNIYNMHQLEHYDERKNRLEIFLSCNEFFYIYGAGKYGVSLLEELKEQISRVKGIIVSDGMKQNKCIEGINIYELHEIDKNAPIILAVGYEFMGDIIKDLTDREYVNFICGY